MLLSSRLKTLGVANSLDHKIVESSHQGLIYITPLKKSTHAPVCSADFLAGFLAFFRAVATLLSRVQVYFCLVPARVARSWWPGPGSRWPGPGGPVPVPGPGGPSRAAPPFFAVARWPGPGPGPGPCRLSCPGLVLVARWPGPGPGPGSGLL